MDLDGCSVVEYRRDREGMPVLMEVNPRMAGSVGLAVTCGVDFPGLLRWNPNTMQATVLWVFCGLRKGNAAGRLITLPGLMSCAAARTVQASRHDL